MLPPVRRAPRSTAAAVVLLGAALLAVPLVGTGPQAHAADSTSVRSKAVLTLTGHGYGHGHGLSQYGAGGAARKGIGYRKIVETYYPGTKWADARGKVRVLITADTTSDVVVVARSGLRARAVTAKKSFELAKAEPTATRWRIKPGKGARSSIDYKTAGWHRYRLVEGDTEFSAGQQPVALVLPSGARVAYRGKLRSAAPVPGNRARDTVNVVSLDGYLKGVVPREVPALWPTDAVRAQAVAARTYAAYERAHPLARHYQICDTTSCQVYGGYSAEDSHSNAAVDDTRAQILTSKGAPAFTQFSSSNGGWSAAGQKSYLPARQDPYEAFSDNPNATWKARVTDRQIEQAWPGIGDLRKVRLGDRDGHGQWGGRVGTVRLVGASGSTTLNGDSFRSVLGLRSTWFIVSAVR